MTASAIKQIAQFSDPKPVPLSPEKLACSPYPIEALGSLLSAVANEIATGVQVPPVMAAQSVLAAAALAVQPFANALLDGRQYPLNLFMLTVAESGDRKSGVDKIATAPHKLRQRQLYDDFHEDLQRFKNELEAYEITRKHVIGADKKNGPEVIACALHELGLPPTQPRLPTMLSQEPTIEGLVKGFASGQPSQGLFSDEGGSFFGGHSLKDENKLKSIAGLSQLWDGSDINRTRAAHGESMTIKNPRLSAHLMIQPIVAASAFLDPELSGQGFLARFLIAAPESIAGTRFYNDMDLTLSDAVNNYQNLMAKLLREPLPVDQQGTLTPRHLQVDGNAKTLWKDAYNAIERELAPRMQLNDIKPTAGKMAEQIIRIAGVITLIDNFDAKVINAQSMGRAIQLGSWYLQEALRLSTVSSAATDYQIAAKVIDWILEKGRSVVTVNHINKNKVAKLNGANRCREILLLLEDNNWLIRLPPATQIDGKHVKEAWRLNQNALCNDLGLQNAI
ncbi:YfjI family protein [Rheinheimera baltica]|uniref:YfjI family protein n=1 Tax=Rheinheimera baltica TaxID=67576 RepID=UPI00273EAABA|nr:YfjI family protein [Rheinheimera baltica]MDP5149926.1 YfjI family protein [Rheinheimera baltica]